MADKEKTSNMDPVHKAVYDAWQSIPDLKTLNIRELAWLVEEYNTLSARVVRELRERIRINEEKEYGKES